MVLKDFWRIDQTEKETKADSHSSQKQMQLRIKGHASL